LFLYRYEGFAGGDCAVVSNNTALPVYGHGTGHGLGLEVHELPIISGKTKGVLRAGQVRTIEPGVYIPAKLGVRIEDDILVTQTGCTVLSSSAERKIFERRRPEGRPSCD